MCLLSFLLPIPVLVAQRVRLFTTSWTVDRQAPLSIGFLRQEYWSGMPFPSPGDIPDPGIEPEPATLAGGFHITEPPGKPLGNF